MFTIREAQKDYVGRNFVVKVDVDLTDAENFRGNKLMAVKWLRSRLPCLSLMQCKFLVEACMTAQRDVAVVPSNRRFHNFDELLRVMVPTLSFGDRLRLSDALADMHIGRYYVVHRGELIVEEYNGCGDVTWAWKCSTATEVFELPLQDFPIYYKE